MSLNISGKNLISCTLSGNSADSFQAYNPIAGEHLPEKFINASPAEIELAISTAVTARNELSRISPLKIANFMTTLAHGLDSNLNILIERCASETALPKEPRLKSELSRVQSFLRMYSELIKSGDVAGARISPSLPNRQPAARADIRSQNIGIGPVVVIESSNFPFAFGIIGNDTASAWTAGCPVISKAHPFHPGTSELIAQIVSETIQKADLPPGIFSMLHSEPNQFERVILDPRIKGVGFTGSREVGKRIQQLAAQRDEPLELSLELGSVNPMFIFSNALEEHYDKFIQDLCTVALQGCGQFCTSPGIIFIAKSGLSSRFIEEFKEKYLSQGPQILLGKSIASRFAHRIEEVRNCKDVTIHEGFTTNSDFTVSPTLIICDSNAWLNNPTLQQEIFGPALVFVETDQSDFIKCALQLNGELTAAIHLSPNDSIKDVQDLSYLLETRVGRLIFNGYSPGVELCDAITHTGPWPSALSRHSVVGPRAVERWQRSICYQFPEKPIESLLPEALLPSNPLNITRRIDGSPSKEQI